MYESWIYQHFINTSLFVGLCLALPLAFGVWLLISLAKIGKEDQSN